jgi:hypothetical protein
MSKITPSPGAAENAGADGTATGAEDAGAGSTANDAEATEEAGATGASEGAPMQVPAAALSSVATAMRRGVRMIG